ncbi:methyl-accepting chemotaxis protein [Paenibacillus sp. CAA11]|uniref:methyl-accepting chemotaxis protein n=1 Tax=Paenibacillus sp. CAA11 TaxID=1532905 RepID=UPI000D39C213|nr:methyl-accepting chemotaxis protein [Paenibacillus sp. CAA11]AWB45663.1 methyl-accepting chemotaxis protein [Paenibacillus sp. CAA11]
MGLVPKKKNKPENNHNRPKKGGAEEGKEINKVQTKGLSGPFKKAITYLRGVRIKQLDPTRSVGIRLFLIFFVAIMVFVLSLGIVSYQLAKNTIQKNALSANRQTVIQTSEKLDIIFKRYEDSMQQMFVDQEMQSLIQTALATTGGSDYDRFTVTNSINKKMSSLNYTVEGVRAVYLLPLNNSLGNVVTGTSDVDFMSTMKDQAWYDELSKQSGSVWLSVDGDKGKNMFRWVKSIKTLTGTNQFLIACDVDVSVVTEQLKKVDLGEGSKVELITPEGQIIGSSIDEENGQKVEYSFIKDSKKEQDSLTTKDLKGDSILAVYSTQQVSGWKLTGIVPTGNLVKDARGILLSTYLSVIVVAIIAVLLGIWMVRMIARPLSKLNGLMQEGAKGNLNVRIDHKTKDEIGQLSASFNVMMEKITELVQQANGSARDVLDTASELAEASKKTAISAKEIAVATEEIANGAGSLASEAERGSELTEGIGSQVHEVISANKEMEASAREVEKSSQLGTEYLQGLMEKTNATGEITRALAEKVEALKESTVSVLKVVDVMQNITQQTNILSLNATIEAARAGAAGRGFMVVADEIRQLAEQSKQSITMVGQITDKIQQEMYETVQALSDASPMFAEQITSVQETNQIFVSVQEQMVGFISKLDSVTTSVQGLSQSQGVLSEAMTNVSAVAQQSSATSEEVASLSNEQQLVGDQLVQLSDKLEKVSTGLKDSLSKFTF